MPGARSFRVSKKKKEAKKAKKIVFETPEGLVSLCIAFRLGEADVSCSYVSGLKRLAL
jgi:hypothetical protein